MKQVTEPQFYASIGDCNVHPYIISDKYPYTTEWRDPKGRVFGRMIPKIDEKYAHLYTEECFLSDDIEIKHETQKVSSVLDMSDI